MRTITTALFLAIFTTTLSAHFAPGVSLSTNMIEVREVRVADVDGDLDMDVVVRQPNAIGWFENDGEGSFGSFVTIHVSVGELGAFDIADVQGDGLPDVVVADAGVDAILLLSNDGIGGFGPPEFVLGTDGGSIGRLHLADVFGGPEPELLYRSGDVLVCANEGGAFLEAEVITTSGGFSFDFQVLDMDGDGYLDIANFQGLTPTLSIWLNPGMQGEPWLNVQSASMGNVGGRPTQVLDVDGDGDMDLANAANHFMQWWKFPLQGEEPYVLGALVGGNTPEFSRRGYTARLGCGPGASMLWTDSISQPVKWVTYDAVLGGFGPVGNLSELPSFLEIGAGDIDGDGREDLVLWHDEVHLAWFRSNIQPSIVEVELAPFDTLCNAPVPYQLVQAQIEGGTWSGMGVQGEYFIPDGHGDVDLFYTILDPEFGCPHTVAGTIRVISVPTVTSEIPLNDPCAVGQTQLTGSPVGGTWGGVVNVFGIIDNDTLSRPTTENLIYSFTDASGSTCQHIGMYSLQSYSLLGYSDPGPFCQSVEPSSFMIAGPLQGGVFATGDVVLNVVPGIAGAEVIINVSEPGYHMIELVSMSPLQCTTIVIDSVRVDLCTGIPELDHRSEALKVYPSPNRSKSLFVDHAGVATIDFVDTSGRAVLSIAPHLGSMPIDIGILQAGLYSVVSSCNGHRKIGRLVIE